jgi:hypothetical protein
MNRNVVVLGVMVSAKEVGVDPDPRAGHGDAAALLNPVLAGRATGRWNPKKASWSDSFIEIVDDLPERGGAENIAKPSAPS